jgi:hypothetical protein
MKVILPILFYLSIGYYFYARDRFFNRKVTIFIGLKALALISFLVLYTNFLTGDLDMYLLLSEKWENLRLHQIFSAYDPRFPLEGQSRFTLFFQHFFAVMYIIGFKNLYLTGFCFLALSLIFTLETYLILKKESEEISDTFLLAMCVPTILFWTSSICKELLVLPMFCYVLAWLRDFYLNRRVAVFQLVVLLVSIWVLFNSRFFYLPFVGFVVWFYCLLNFFKNPFFWAISVLLILLYLVGQRLLLPHLQQNILLELIHTSYHQIYQMSGDGKCLRIDFEQKTWLGVLWGYVQGLSGVFFVKFDTPLSVIVSVENMVLIVLLLFVFSFTKWRKLPLEFWVFLVFVVLVSGLITLVSPNYGSLSRYRVIYWFFVWGFVIHQLKSLPIFRRL